MWLTSRDASPTLFFISWCLVARNVSALTAVGCTQVSAVYSSEILMKICCSRNESNSGRSVRTIEDTKCLRPLKPLRSWIRIPVEKWMSVCVYSTFVLSFVGSGVFLVLFFSFLRWGWDWAHLERQPQTVLLYQPRMIDDECGAVGGMRTDRGNQSNPRKPAPLPLCPPQISHDLTWARTRAAAVGSRRLTAWAITRPFGELTRDSRAFSYVVIHMANIQGVPGGMCQTSGGCSLC
jgi:hypothetical protein